MTWHEWHEWHAFPLYILFQPSARELKLMSTMSTMPRPLGVAPLFSHCFEWQPAAPPPEHK